MDAVTVVVGVLDATVASCRRSNGPARANDAAKAMTRNADFILDSCRLDHRVPKNDSVELDRSRVTEAANCTDRRGRDDSTRRWRDGE